MYFFVSLMKMKITLCAVVHEDSCDDEKNTYLSLRVES